MFLWSHSEYLIISTYLIGKYLEGNYEEINTYLKYETPDKDNKNNENRNEKDDDGEKDSIIKFLDTCNLKEKSQPQVGGFIGQETLSLKNALNILYRVGFESNDLETILEIITKGLTPTTLLLNDRIKKTDYFDATKKRINKPTRHALLRELNDLYVEANRKNTLSFGKESSEYINKEGDPNNDNIKKFITKFLLEKKLKKEEKFQKTQYKYYKLLSDILSKKITLEFELSKIPGINDMEKKVFILNVLNKSYHELIKNKCDDNDSSVKNKCEKCLNKKDGPIIAATDYMRSFADQIRPYTSKSFYSLGTDGYGRSDSRKNLRKFFEVDKEHIVAFTLSALAKEQLVSVTHAEHAIKKYKIDKDKLIPTLL